MQYVQDAQAVERILINEAYFISNRRSGGKLVAVSQNLLSSLQLDLSRDAETYLDR